MMPVGPGPLPGDTDLDHFLLAVLRARSRMGMGCIQRLNHFREPAPELRCMSLSEVAGTQLGTRLGSGGRWPRSSYFRPVHMRSRK